MSMILRLVSRTLLALTFALAACAGAWASAAPTATELIALASPGELALSGDGRFAAFTLSRSSRDSTAVPNADDSDGGWKRTRQLVLLDLTSAVMRTLTSGEDRASAPAFAPDGRTLAFMRKGAIWMLPLAGGEAVKLDTGKLSPEGFRYAPDGRSIAFTAAAERTPADIESAWHSGGAFDWNEQWQRSALWVMPVAGGGAHRASPESLHVSDFVWSPEGKRFVALTTRSSDPYEAFNFPQPRVLDAADGHVLTTLERRTESYGTAYGNLAWTPDGKRVVMTGLNGGLSNTNALLVWDVTTGALRDLAPDPDLTLDGLVLLPGGREVFAVQKARTETRFLRFPLAGGPAVDSGFRGRVTGGSPLIDALGRTLVFLSSSPSEPSEVTTFDLASKRVRVVTALNPVVATWALGRTEVVRWDCPEGGLLEGLLTRPPGATSATPLIVMPHGGPDDVTQQSFNAQVQYFATHGYAVFRPNYRGGTGYGFAFYAANRNRFGEIEQMDIESGVDGLIALGLADPARLFYGGWSWGGYLSAWTLGHVQRYRAFVVGAGVNDVAFSYTSSDINHGVAAQWEYKGNPFQQTEHFDRANPIRYAKDMRTPTLILHGQADDRVHFLNGLTLYRALTDVGTPVKFVAYPREPHGFQEPAHLVHRLETWTRWYDEHGGATPARP